MLEPARRLCRPGLGRPAGLRRARRLLLFALTLLGGVDPLLALPSRALAAASVALPTALSSSACAAPISRSAPGWSPRSTAWSSRRSSRSAAAPACRCRRRVTSFVRGIEWIKTLFDVRTPAARDIVVLWAGARLVAARSRSSTWCCARATAWRSPRSATTRTPPPASASTLRAPSSRSMSSPPRDRPDRRADLSSEGAHLAGRRLRRARLDRLRDLHRRDRRHRHDRGPDRRRRSSSI